MLFSILKQVSTWENFKIMNIKRKITISIIIVLAITSLIIYFVILPTAEDIKKISNDVYLERVDLEKKYLRGQLLKKTIKDFEEIKPEQDKLASIFIMEGEELKFITALEKISAANNLEQNLQLQTNQSKISKDELYYTLPLKVTVQGSFDKILKYLQDLEKINYYFNVSSINISAKNSAEIITAVMDGEIYALIAKTEE